MPLVSEGTGTVHGSEALTQLRRPEHTHTHARRHTLPPAMLPSPSSQLPAPTLKSTSHRRVLRSGEAKHVIAGRERASRITPSWPAPLLWSSFGCTFLSTSCDIWRILPHTPIPCIPRAGLREKLSVPPPTPSSHDAATADGRVAVGIPATTVAAGIEEKSRAREAQS